MREVETWSDVPADINNNHSHPTSNTEWLVENDEFFKQYA